MAKEAQRVLGYLGIPWIQAPGEGESQAAFIVRKGDAWATASRDFDTLLFGAPRLLRYLTLTGKKRLPSRGTSVPLEPELIELSRVLSQHGITREQLVDIALLIGTDFNAGIPQVGPKTALKLIVDHQDLEHLPEGIRSQLPANYPQLRDLFLHHPVTEDYDLTPGAVDKEGLVAFLCHERGFAEERVLGVIERLTEVQQRQRQRSLDSWTRGQT
jgi:flap endonuclease-1